MPKIEPRLICVAIYLRVSTARQLRGYGLDVQLEECLAWLDFTLGKGRYTCTIYTDGAVSGKLAFRPDLAALDADLVQCLYDMVVFGKLDRIGRTMREIHRWIYNATDIDTGRGRRVRVATADSRIDSEHPMFGLQLSLLAYMAELEHALLLERTLGGREKKLAAGGWPGGVAPFWVGLPARGRNEAPILRPQGVELLEVAAWLIADEGLVPAEAAKTLNALGYMTARGMPWTGENLSRVFRQTALDGYILFRFRQQSRTRQGYSSVDEASEQTQEVRVPVPMPLPADRVRQVRQLLTRHSPERRAQRDYLLSGRLVSLCGHRYTGAHRQDRGRTAYRCTRRHSDPSSRCREILAGPLEDMVWGEITKFLVERLQARAVVKEWAGVAPGEARELAARLAALDARIVRSRRVRKNKLIALAGAVATEEGVDNFIKGELAAALAEIRDDFSGTEQRLRHLREAVADRLAAAGRRKARADQILEHGLDLENRLSLLTREQRFALLDLLEVEVRIVSDVPGAVRSGGCPFEAWFADCHRTVPPPLSDEQWAELASCFPQPRKRSRVVPPRVAFEASLYKVRHGLQWDALPESVLQGQRSRSVYQRALKYLHDGCWQRAVCALGDYEGTALPPLYFLPDIEVTCALEPSWMNAPGDIHVRVTGQK
ncbi:recombinase family protein [Streptomyces hydrogenans]|uniref:recombinase family protein n=2 Tax=Streptomyces hydrogenans TaxID=1873719 RepID=UPI003662D3BA